MLQQLPAVVVFLNVVLLWGTMIYVGHTRRKFAIKAPATSGHPGFERAYRVQMNTLEGSVMFLPALWLATHYGFSVWASAAGLVWIICRLWYAFSYVKDPGCREYSFLLAMLAWFAIVVMAFIGLLRSLVTA